MNVLLTGATGYVGRHLLSLLLDTPHQITAAVRDATRAALLPRGVTPLIASFEALEAQAEAARAADAVIHVGFPAYGADWAAGVAAEHKLIATWCDELKGSGKPLIVSNGTIFLGDSGSQSFDESQPVMAGHPAAIRAVATAPVTDVQTGLRGVELRLASFVYGQGGSIFLPGLIRAAKQHGRSIQVGNGQAATSAVHVLAAAKAYVLALQENQAQGIYHLASDEQATTGEIAQAVGILTGMPVEAMSAEAASTLIDPFLAQFLSTNNRLDSQRARQELGWRHSGLPTMLWDVAFGSYRR